MSADTSKGTTVCYNINCNDIHVYCLCMPPLSCFVCASWISLWVCSRIFIHCLNVECCIFPPATVFVQSTHQILCIHLARSAALIELWWKWHKNSNQQTKVVHFQCAHFLTYNITSKTNNKNDLIITYIVNYLRLKES